MRDEVILEDPAEGKCVYQVTGSLVVEPEDASVMEPGKSIVSLRTCTVPGYSDRLIVRGEPGAWKGRSPRRSRIDRPRQPRSRRNRYQTRPSP